jgi:hypothetical protein
MTIILHYYPGQFHKPSNTLKSGVYVNGNTEITIADDTTVGGGLLVVLKDGKEIYRAEAWGGPSKKIAIKGSMPQLPTPAGKYVIGPIMRYHTPS